MSFTIHKWTPEEVELLRSLWPTGADEIAARVGVPKSVVKSKAKAIGLPAETSVTLEQRAARDALVLAIYPDRSLSPNDVLARVNALPGPAVGRHWLSDAARRLGCQRAVGLRPAAAMPVVTAANPEGRVASRGEREVADRRAEVPIVAPFIEVSKWAVEHGVEFCDWGDLRAVNHARDLALEPWFARPLACHRRVGL